MTAPARRELVRHLADHGLSERQELRSDGDHTDATEIDMSEQAND